MDTSRYKMQSLMKAVVHDQYGPPEVLHIEEVDRPVPKDDEVLIRIRASTVSRSDCALRAGEPFFSRFLTGLPRPRQRILGGDYAGVVEEAGGAVTDFKVGDRVFGMRPWKFGGHAEFMSMQQSGPIALMPAGATFDDAAAIPDGAILTLNCLRPGKVRSGQSVLVFGASGSMGTAGVQLSKALGAHVTAVCNAKDVDLVRSLGADEVIDYTQEDFTKNGTTYDVIFDSVGKQSFAGCKDSLNPGGVYLPTDGLRNVVFTAWTSRIGDRKVVFDLPPKFTKKDMLFLKGLMEAGKYRAVIDRRYPLEEVVEATRYVELHEKVGNVVLTIGSGIDA
jgi:NADPH:quinone reductase-like Zn-dependent oxidoreductase